MKTVRISTDAKISATSLADLISKMESARDTFASHNAPYWWILRMIRTNKISPQFGAKTAVLCILNGTKEVGHSLRVCLDPDDIDGCLNEKKSSLFRAELAEELKKKLNKGQLAEIESYLKSIE